MTTNHPPRHDAATLPVPKPLRVSNNWVARALTFLLVFGPGLIVMEADNDAGAVSTYVQGGAEYGTHLLWLLLLLLRITYFVQEMVVRLGIATGGVSEEGRNPMARPALHLAALFVCFVIAAGAQDSSSEARRMNNEGAALYAAGKFEAAGRLYRAALALQPGDPLIVAAITGNLGALYKRQNRYAEALRMYQEALDLRRKWLPPTRPEVAYSMNNLAEIYRLEGRYWEARSLTEAAVDALRRSDPASPYMPVFLNNLDSLERKLHRLDKADPLLQQAYRLAETSSGPESRVLAIVLNSQGQLLTDKQDFETAERLYRRSATILENSGPDQAGELAVALANMGRVLGLLSRNEEARQTELRALTLLYNQPCRDDLLYATILRNLGTLAAAEDHMADSLTYFDQSLAAQERILGPDHPLIADVLFDYAAAEQRAGAKSQAQRLRKRAERLIARQRRDDLSRYTVDAAAFQNLR